MTPEGFADDEDVAVDSHPAFTNSTEEDITIDNPRAQSRKSRPSLSERTVETLSRLPSSPAFKRRGSNFFEADGLSRPQSKGSMGSRSRPGSRPGSSYQSDGSTVRSARSLSRPGSSSGQPDNLYTNFRASTNTHKPPVSGVLGAAAKRGLAGNSKPPVSKATPSFTPRSSLTKVASRSSLSVPLGSRSPSPEKRAEPAAFKQGYKTVAGRPLKPRASINSLYRKPSLPSLDKPLLSEAPSHPSRKASLASAKSSSTSGDGRNLSSASTTSTALTVDSIEEASGSTARKSSAALRDQIAKAKAAKRAATKQAPATKISDSHEAPVIPTDTTFDFGLSDDPFGQRKFEDANRKVMQSRINTARTTGKLNIAAMGLKQIPPEVLKMYDLESVDGAGIAWAESVDITRLVAADNELETIDDAIFPDKNPSDTNEDDVEGHFFGGLESLDLHGNMLIALPMGLRRLQLLTSLNLASNKLTNNCLEVISQLTTVRDLKLGKNLLYGRMEKNYFANLINLEILDLHGNNISSLPDGIDKLVRLRMLNLNENALEDLPFESLSKLPLTELQARKNKLSGTLIGPSVRSFPQLQILDVAANQIRQIVDGAQPLSLPSLHQLTLSMNRIISLPDMTSWTNLLTINADENSIAAFPEGFLGLENLRHVDFTSNDIRIIPPEIARMNNLAMLRITGNPLKDKKFTSLTTEELKDALALRLEPLPPSEVGGIENFGNGFSRDPPPKNRITTNNLGNCKVEEEEGRSELDDFTTPPTSTPTSTANSTTNSPARSRSHTLTSQTWPIKPGGLLDRSNTESSSLHPVVCSKIAVAHTIREVRLQHNTFTQFPNSLSFFADTITSLSMADNQLTGESWLTEPIDLTALKELSLATNFITSLTPLTTNFCAPNLQKVDLSFNRIVKLPTLRDFFPSLTMLLISNNRLEEIEPVSIKGMKVVDASNNEISHLHPRIGLLGGTGGLEKFEVTGNRFRVPRWNVLERGTEATLRWLRGRVPVAEMAEWRAKAGEGEGEGSEDDVD